MCTGFYSRHQKAGIISTERLAEREINHEKILYYYSHEAMSIKERCPFNCEPPCSFYISFWVFLKNGILITLLIVIEMVKYFTKNLLSYYGNR